VAPGADVEAGTGAADAGVELEARSPRRYAVRPSSAFRPAISCLLGSRGRSRQGSTSRESAVSSNATPNGLTAARPAAACGANEPATGRRELGVRAGDRRAHAASPWIASSRSMTPFSERRRELRRRSPQGRDFRAGRRSRTRSRGAGPRATAQACLCDHAPADLNKGFRPVRVKVVQAVSGRRCLCHPARVRATASARELCRDQRLRGPSRRRARQAAPDRRHGPPGAASGLVP
jgi:hypothetical protein